MSGLVLSVFEKNWPSVGMVIAGACTCRNHRIRIHTGDRESERRTHLLDSAFLRADGVPILELVLCKVELRHGDPVLYLMDRSLKLCLANGH
jgi:hypothetical protein